MGAMQDPESTWVRSGYLARCVDALGPTKSS